MTVKGKTANMPKNSSRSKAFFAFERTALVIGFVVDSITIVSILLALVSVDDTSSLSLPTFITPALAWGVWFLAMYTCLALLHGYWERHRHAAGYSKHFRTFLVVDLVRFRNPILLFPLIVLVILLFVIIYITLPETTVIWAIAAGVMIVLTILSVAIGEADVQEGSKSPEMREWMRTIESEWSFFNDRISRMLEGSPWVTEYDLRRCLASRGA